MKYFEVVVEVDEKELLKEYPGMSILEATSAELNWVHESGIYVVSIKEKK